MINPKNDITAFILLVLHNSFSKNIVLPCDYVTIVRWQSVFFPFYHFGCLCHKIHLLQPIPSFRKKKCYYIHVILYSYRKSCATLICSNDLLENFNLPTCTISHSFSISYSFYTASWKVNSIKLYTQSRFLVGGWNIAEDSATYMFVRVFVYVHISTFIISDEN